ncbi:MAG: PGF-CTERM-anchored ABC transporter substrate-binding protein [Natronomonas sp.]|jgi:iron complex transport system substrate-binding protein|uniref:PGF-CTERM-anchored ABC transporter substrate-binding protein n=1 Tax=Natronomonas sp. TaxID=2184060 RepID=UPI00287059BD|nr:PGF-CTERM-anchored ABC transporter substrate-binding protein [Natronomonas sp.]MDR9382362.1 PGF-CTERM-anchored ABC transporter substrate-binding protein [Natronomonas sp.]MDR9430347.1 PGF-CTERM-anchored ABC transporter substrate-binding protein [Natronomonas sp.]
MRSQTSLLLVSILVVASIAATVPMAAADTHASACSFPVSETDATGETVTVEERPERIVVLQPSAAQTVWELDAQGRVVGAPVAPYTDYLQGIDEKQNVLNLDEFSVNREAVVELDADIVLAPNIVPNETVEQLRGANQTVFKFGVGTSLEFIADKTELTGRLIGSCEEAANVNEAYWDRIESARAATEGGDAPRVLHYTDNFTAGSGTFIDEIIAAAGGENVAAKNGIEGYGRVNDEAVVRWNPEVILVADDGPGVPETAAFESTFAVRNEQVVVVDGNYLSQPGPRIAIAIEELATALSDATLESDDAAETDAIDDRTSTPTPMASAPEDQTGFGILSALVALTALGLFARRR